MLLIYLDCIYTQNEIKTNGWEVEEAKEESITGQKFSGLFLPI